MRALFVKLEVGVLEDGKPQNSQMEMRACISPDNLESIQGQLSLAKIISQWVGLAKQCFDEEVIDQYYQECVNPQQTAESLRKLANHIEGRSVHCSDVTMMNTSFPSLNQDGTTYIFNVTKGSPNG